MANIDANTAPLLEPSVSTWTTSETYDLLSWGQRKAGEKLVAPHIGADSGAYKMTTRRLLPRSVFYEPTKKRLHDLNEAYKETVAFYALSSGKLERQSSYYDERLASLCASREHVLYAEFVALADKGDAFWAVVPFLSPDEENEALSSELGGLAYKDYGAMVEKMRAAALARAETRARRGMAAAPAAAASAEPAHDEERLAQQAEQVAAAAPVPLSAASPDLVRSVSAAAPRLKRNFSDLSVEVGNGVHPVSAGQLTASTAVRTASTAPSAPEKNMPCSCMMMNRMRHYLCWQKEKAAKRSAAPEEEEDDEDDEDDVQLSFRTAKMQKK